MVKKMPSTKLWNLTDPDSLQETVVSSFVTAPTVKTARRTSHSKSTYMKVALGVAALTSTLILGSLQASAQGIAIPVPAATSAQSVPRPQPPLEDVFINRFDQAWTDLREADLLKTLDERRIALCADDKQHGA